MKPKASDAHKLLGQIYEGLGKKDKAVQAYKTAYELSKEQKDVVQKSKTFHIIKIRIIILVIF